MPKRKADDDEWELWKDEIISLYRQKPIDEVQKAMKDQHGFSKKYAVSAIFSS
jgi:hypothetical protein